MSEQGPEGERAEKRGGWVSGGTRESNRVNFTCPVAKYGNLSLKDLVKF